MLVKYQVEVGQEGLADIYISRLKEHCNLFYDLGFRRENDMAWEQPPEDRGLIKCQKGKCRQHDFFIFTPITKHIKRNLQVAIMGREIFGTECKRREKWDNGPR